MADFRDASLEEVKAAWMNWADNMMLQLRHNYESQKIFPMGWPGPYPGYQYENAKKRQSSNKSSWVSTGESFRNIYSMVYKGASGNPELIQFFFRYYLMFADMGVGKGTKYGQVDNATKAHWGRLYKKWGDTHYDGRKTKKSKVPSVKTTMKQSSRRSRPHLMMEFRHQLTRLELIVTEYYSKMGEEGLYRAIMGMDVQGFDY